MERKGNRPELLAPAGSEEAFYAALAAGADAIYLGGKAYSARAFAENFDNETLLRCIRDAHARGVRVYVTLNILFTDREIPNAMEYARQLYDMGADAIICADIGLMWLLHRYLPGLPLHASTQLSLHSVTGAREIEDLGVETAVLARELDAKNIARAVKNAPQQVEIFIHGALCVCYSGQCLFSSLVGGRSGNRGECAQPCRLPYNGGYPLSLKDLCLAAHIPELIDTGVASLKIEGRMKAPSYVWGVTKIFRRLLDENRSATTAEIKELADIFSRDGFTDGYYTARIENGMTGVRRDEDKENSRETQSITTIPVLPAIRLFGKCVINADVPATLTLTDAYGKSATVKGEIPAPAKNAPLTAEAVGKRLCKLGGTPYEMKETDIIVTVGEGLNLSPASLNALRRAAVEKLCAPHRERSNCTKEIDTAWECNAIEQGKKSVIEEGGQAAATYRFRLPPARGFYDGVNRTAVFYRAALWKAIGSEAAYFDCVYIPLWELNMCESLPLGVWLPPVITDIEEPEVLRLLAEAKARGVKEALCGNPAQIAMAREIGLRVTADFRLNITNVHAASYWKEHGVADAVLSPELTAPQLRDIGGRVIVWGRIPLMLTERCYATEQDCHNCKEACKEGVVLRDRRGTDFPIMRIPPHRNLILNSLPTYLCDKRGELPDTVREHYLFTNETESQCRSIISAAKKGATLPYPVRRLPHK